MMQLWVRGLSLYRWQVMQHMMTVRYNSVEERFIGCIKLFSDTWSGLIAVIETFASAKTSSLTSIARPNWTCICQLGHDNSKKDLLNAFITHGRALTGPRKLFRILFLHRSPVRCWHDHSLEVDWRWLPQVPWCCWHVEFSVRLEEVDLSAATTTSVEYNFKRFVWV